MTKTEALYKFFNSFGVEAYPSDNVPARTYFPYMTYENTISNFNDEVDITAQLWFNTNSEAVPNSKVDEIAEAIGLGGVNLAYDGGMIWVNMGVPFAQAISEDNDTALKRRILNLTLTFL